MSTAVFNIRFAWDAEAEGWYVADSDIPGLNAEADTVDALVAKVKTMARELIVLNRHLIGVSPDNNVRLHWTAERNDAVEIPS